MSGGHGGARAGAGRKSKAEKYEAQIAAGEQFAADHLVTNIQTLQDLAFLDRETVHEEWVPAGMVVIDDIVTGDEGKTTKVKRLAFPDLPATELVLVKRRVVKTGPSETAAMYLIDRIMGKPTAHIEGDINNEVKLPPPLLDMITKVYGNGDGSGS